MKKNSIYINKQQKITKRKKIFFRVGLQKKIIGDMYMIKKIHAFQSNLIYIYIDFDFLICRLV